MKRKEEKKMPNVLFSAEETQKVAEEVAAKALIKFFEMIKQDIKNMNVPIDECEKAVLSPDQIVERTKMQAINIMDTYLEEARSLIK